MIKDYVVLSQVPLDLFAWWTWPRVWVRWQATADKDLHHTFLPPDIPSSIRDVPTALSFLGKHNIEKVIAVSRMMPPQHVSILHNSPAKEEWGILVRDPFLAEPSPEITAPINTGLTTWGQNPLKLQAAHCPTAGNMRPQNHKTFYLSS